MDKNYRSYRLFFIALGIVTSLLVAALCPETLLPAAMSKTAALVVITIFLLATAAIPEYLTALLFFLVAMLFAIAPADVIFSGFSSGAFWLVFGGLIIGIAISATGLGERIAIRLATCVNGSYLKILTGMAVVGLLFAFIMPSSMGRILLLVPIASAVADHFCFGEETNGRTGIILVTTLCTFIPAFSIMPANVPAIIAVGMAESQFDLSPLFGSYLFLHFPVLGLLKTIVIVVVVFFLYADTPTQGVNGIQQKTATISQKERVLSVVLFFLLVLWATDCFHHISPAWIALGGALFLLLPQTGIVSGELFATRVNYGSLFFVAGVIGVGNLFQYSGMGAILGERLLSLLPLSGKTPFLSYIAITVVISWVGLLTTLPGVPAVITPLCPELAAATGFSLSTVFMLQIIGFSTVVLPYQAPPIVVAMQLSREKYINFVKPVSIIALITYFVLIPLDYLWLLSTGYL